MKITDEIKSVLSFIDKTITYPDIATIEGASTNPEVIVNGKKMLIFCSNNYLSTAANPRIKEAMIKAVEKYGMGSGGSRLISGNISIQQELEAKIAKFKGAEDAITFSTGYMTNTGVIPALLEPPVDSIFSYIKNKTFFADKSAVFSDQLNHASIIDGIRLSKADRFVYRHRDMNDLEDKLKHAKKYKRKLIVTDGVFSMDGDIAPLDKIMELADKYDATVMVDDAHATGILGDKGEGTADYFKLDKHPEVTMGTFTKVFGGVGGFVAGSKDLIKYLRVTARSYIFSAPIPPAIAAGIIEAIDIVEKEPERRLRLWSNINHFKNLLEENHFNTLRSETQIIPIFIGDEKKAVETTRRLADLGFFVPCVRWPAVAHGQSILRLTLMADHTKEQINALTEALIKVRKEVGF